jgi:acetyltransferase
MSVRNLDKLFRPERIAVVGASDDHTKVGSIVLRNLVGHGYDGVVYPVNSRREAVHGIAAYPRVADLPHAPDLAIICTPAASVAGLIRECGACGILGVVIISAGFREIGEAGRQLENDVRAAAASCPGLRILGPNCLGFMVPGRSLNASFASEGLPAGRVAFISQSGALGTAIVDWAQGKGVGFSFFASLGNMLDIGFDDLLDYLAADKQTSAVMLYVESINEAREFMSAARALARVKPIVVCKAGRFAESAQAAASHTGAMAGVDEVYDAAFSRAGMVRVVDVDELFDCAELLSKERQLPQGERLAIVTNAGGPGVMATDALLARRGRLAQLKPETIARLSELLPAAWSHGNPVDVLGDAPADRYGQALDVVLRSAEVDAAVVVLTPQAMTEPLPTAQAVIRTAADSQKPVLTSWMGDKSVRAAVELMNRESLPTYRTPEQAVRAFMHLVEYVRRRELLYVTPRDVPLTFKLDRAGLRARFAELTSRGQTVLTEDESKALLDAYGIPVTRTAPAQTADDAVRLATELGYPVVLKVHSPQITHKTEVDGVALDLSNDDDVRRAFERIVRTARKRRPDAEVQGVTVQRMVSFARGMELIVGAKTDPVFGPVIMIA